MRLPAPSAHTRRTTRCCVVLQDKCESKTVYFLPAGAGAVFWKLYVPPNFLLNRSTRPAVSTNFCLPVKNGWQAEQISTFTLACVLRVTKLLPQAQWTLQVR